MGRYIDWYIVELERLLSGQLSSPKLAETLGEVEAHIADSAESLKVTCQHGQDPEKLAVDRFGPPRNFAVDMVLSKLIKPYWKAAIIPVLASIAFYLGVLWNINERGRFPGPLILAFFAAIALAYASWSNRRTSLRAIGGITMAILLIGSLIGAFVTASSANRAILADRRLIPEQVQMLKADREWLQAGMQAYAVADANTLPQEFRTSNGYVVGSANPGYRVSPTNAPAYDSTYGMRRVPEVHPMRREVYGDPTSRYSRVEDLSWEHARKWWAMEAPKSMKIVNTDLDDLVYTKQYYDKVPPVTVSSKFGQIISSEFPRILIAMCLLCAAINAAFAYGSRWNAVSSLDRRQFV